MVTSNLLGKKRSVQIVETIQIMKEIETETTDAHEEVLNACMKIFEEQKLKNNSAVLYSDDHLKYLNFAISSQLPPQMISLDASQPWLLYWIANSYHILRNENIPIDLQKRIIDKLNYISPDHGPFGGGDGQLAHLASNFAAICAIALCVDVKSDAWDKLDTDAIHDWLLLLKQPNGGFKVCHEVGEADVRSTYCALSIASLLNILTPELIKGTSDYILGCQNYEGGFGATLCDDEAHGGYTYCAIASLAILDHLEKCNMDMLVKWCVSRQCDEEKGFCGRSNKLVDGCYGFWIGGACAILEAFQYKDIIWDKEALRDYSLFCSQEKNILGLRDKPGKNPDFYHTNYVLMGICVTESKFSTETNSNSSERCLKINVNQNDEFNYEKSNLSFINPIYGLPNAIVKEFSSYFRKG